MIGAREIETLILPPTFSCHYHPLFQLHLPKFWECFSLWNSSEHDVDGMALELNHLKFKGFKLPLFLLQLLVILPVILILMVLVLAFLVLAIAHNPFGHSLHVDHCLPFFSLHCSYY